MAGQGKISRRVNCATCGKLFITHHSQGKYCNDLCRRIGWRKSWKKYGAKNKQLRTEFGRYWYEANKEKRLAQIKKWQKSENGKKSTAQHDIKMRKKYPEKYMARDVLHKAVVAGRIIPEPCFACGKELVEGHHEDYSRPLDVVWLCLKHHRLLHKIRIKKGGTNEDSKSKGN